MKTLHVLWVFILASIITGCSRYYYQPNAVNAPLLTDANQAHASVTLGGGDDEFDNKAGSRLLMDVQASYSPIKHLGIIGNYSTWNYWAKEIDYNAGHVDAKASMGELGIGSYWANGSLDRVQFVGEIYGGFGVGQLRSDVDFSVSRIFIQPGIGLRHKIVDAAITFRYSMLSYSNLNDHNRGDNYLIGQNLVDNVRNKSIEDGMHYFIEPSFTVRAGYKFLKFQANYTVSNALSHVPWNYNRSRFTLGMYFSLEDALTFGKESSKE